MRHDSKVHGSVDTAQAVNTPPDKDGQASSLESLTPVERASLGMALDHLATRLANIETALAAKNPAASDSRRTLVEITKIVLGGWPTFGLAFLILFYAPLRDAINAIPEKVRTADEIGVMGVSLKSSLRIEAEKAGTIQLSKTLPTLTPAAVELLLRGTRDFNSLIGFAHENDRVVRISLPSEQLLSVLHELHSKELIFIRTSNADFAPDGVDAVRKTIENLHRQFPGKESPAGFGGEGQVLWNLDTPPAKFVLPRLSWALTDLGKKGVDVILRAVSSQLAPVNSKDIKRAK